MILEVSSEICRALAEDMIIINSTGGVEAVNRQQTIRGNENF